MRFKVDTFTTAIRTTRRILLHKPPPLLASSNQYCFLGLKKSHDVANIILKATSTTQQQDEVQQQSLINTGSKQINADYNSNRSAIMMTPTVTSTTTTTTSDKTPPRISNTLVGHNWHGIVINTVSIP